MSLDLAPKLPLGFRDEVSLVDLRDFDAAECTEPPLDGHTQGFGVDPRRHAAHDEPIGTGRNRHFSLAGDDGALPVHGHAIDPKIRRDVRRESLPGASRERQDPKNGISGDRKYQSLNRGSIECNPSQRTLRSSIPT